MSGRRKGNKKSETRGRPLSSSIPLVQQKRSVLYLKKKNVHRPNYIILDLRNSGNKQFIYFYIKHIFHKLIIVDSF